MPPLSHNIRGLEVVRHIIRCRVILLDHVGRELERLIGFELLDQRFAHLGGLGQTLVLQRRSHTQSHVGRPRRDALTLPLVEQALRRCDVGRGSVKFGSTGEARTVESCAWLRGPCLCNARRRQHQDP